MAALAQQFKQGTILTPAEYEAQKTRQQHAEDFIYTMNHAVTCLSLTDFLIAPFFASMFGWNICGHDHGDKGDAHASPSGSGGGGHVHTDSCGHMPLKLSAPAASASPAASEAGAKPMPLRPIAGNAAQGIATLRALGHTVRPEDLPPSPETFIGPPKPPQVEPPKPSIAYYSIVGPEAVAEKKTFLASIKERLHGTKEWFIGEFLGDVGAVPATLLLQRYAPSVMTGIQHITEPVVGGLLRSRTRAAAEKWADHHGLARDAQEVVDRAEQLYTYEMRHMPQMVVWTVASSVINYGVMRYRNPELEFASFAKGKVAGAAITAGLVFGTRTLAPGAAHQWDETMGRKFVVPVTKKIGKVFGVEERDVDRFHARETESDAPKRWAERVQGSETAAVPSLH